MKTKRGCVSLLLTQPLAFWAENAPVAVKVISAKELKDAQVTNLQDALSRLTTNITTHTSGIWL